MTLDQSIKFLAKGLQFGCNTCHSTLDLLKNPKFSSLCPFRHRFLLIRHNFLSKVFPSAILVLSILTIMDLRNRFYLLIILGMIYNLILMISDIKSQEPEDQAAKVELNMNSQNQKTNP